MKKIVLIITSLIISINLFAHSGIMSGQKDIKIAKTKYFDIIYAKGSEFTADLLYQAGDQIYAKLAAQLELKHEFRLPVVISPAQDDHNAYFSSGPFNHIVMFDTVVGDYNAVFSEEFLMTFRHELTHAITYNLRNDFWYGLDKALGDVYNPALLTITTAWAEGATVSMESQFGEGRVNDEYALQMIKQAKIEGKFPKYSSVQGAIDVYPYTTESYMFGGTFNSWLQAKYGMKKYAEFWYRSVNFKNLTYFTCFKKVYGFSIKDAWKEFYDSIEVPVLEKEPAVEEWCSSFEGGKRLSNYKALSSWEKGLCYFDVFKGTVFSYDGEKVKALYKHPAVEKLSYSKDGRFIVESYSSTGKMVPKNKVRIYDVERKSFFKVKENLRDGTLVYDGENYFLAAVKTESHFCEIKLYELKFDEKFRIKDIELVYCRKLDGVLQVFSLEGSSDGRLFYILKNGMAHSIQSLNTSDFEVTDYEIPEERIVVQKLNIIDGVSFGWTKPGCLPRMGLLKPDTGEIFLSETDGSGSFYNPAKLGKEYFYIAKFYDGSKIYKADAEKMDFKTVKAKVSVQKKQSSYNTDEKASELGIIADSKEFSAFAYNFTGPHGTFIPVGYDKSYKPKTLDSLEESVALAGITYISSTPWTNPIWGVTSGYNFENNSTGASIFAQGGSLTDVFTYNAWAHIGFNAQGFKQNYDELTVSSRIPISGVSYIKASDKGSFYVDTRRFLAINKLSTGIGNIYRDGKGVYDYSGVQLTVNLETDYYSLTDNFDAHNDYGNAGFTILAKNAVLFPLTFEASLFPTSNYLAAGMVKAVLFNKEIQGSTNGLPLFYANRITLSSYYLAKCRQEINSWAVCHLPEYLTEGSKSYCDQLAVTATFYVTPNIGGLARPNFQVGLAGSALYRFFPEENQNNFQFSLGIESSF